MLDVGRKLEVSAHFQVGKVRVKDDRLVLTGESLYGDNQGKIRACQPTATHQTVADTELHEIKVLSLLLAGSTVPPSLERLAFGKVFEQHHVGAGILLFARNIKDLQQAIGSLGRRAGAMGHLGPRRLRSGPIGVR